MKLLYILPYPRFFTQHNRVGGHITHCIGILNAFKKQGVAIRYFSEESDPLLEQLGVELRTFPDRFKTFIGRQLWLLMFLLEVNKQIYEFKPNVIYMRYSTSVALWYLLIKKIVGTTPLILEVNSLGSQRIKQFSFFDKRMLKTATTVIVISALLREYISTLFGINTTVVPNGIDPNRISEELVLNRKRSDGGTFNIVYAGLLKPEYGLEAMITAMDALIYNIPNLNVIFYGDGPLAQKLEELAETRKWVCLAGPVDFTEMPEKLTTADILFYPTSKFNQFQSPIKLFEYMAAARPIVAAKTEQTTTLLNDGKFGYLFQLNNEEELKIAILGVYNNQIAAYKMAAEARRYVLSNYTWDSRIEMILHAVQGVKI